MSVYYQDESVTLHHGDCREVTEWLAADVLVTDPPYGMAVGAGISTYKATGRSRQSERAVVGDRDTEARDSVLGLWLPKPAVVFGTWRVPRPPRTQHRLIWHKGGMTSGSMRAPFMTQDEEIYVLGKGFRKSAPPQMSVISTWESRVHAVREGHPTPKPVNLMALLIDRCPPGVVADPFAGSGSTLVAAKAQGRKAIGVEIEERYCDLIASRLAQDVLDFGETA